MDYRMHVTLLENGAHAFWRACETYADFRGECSGEKLLLKDATISLHRGIELLLKEMLRRQSLFFLFRDLDAVALRQQEADQQETDLFGLLDPPAPITFAQTIDYVAAFASTPELRRQRHDSALRARLLALDRYCTRLEHSDVEADESEVVQFFIDLCRPITRLVAAKLRIALEDLQSTKALYGWRLLEQTHHLHLDRIEQTRAILTEFQGQELPGRLLAAQASLMAPQFAHILTHAEAAQTAAEHGILDYPPAIWAESEDARWIVDLRFGGVTTYMLSALAHHARLVDATPWLICFPCPCEDAKIYPARMRVMRQRARQRGILFSAEQDWRLLREGAPDESSSDG